MAVFVLISFDHSGVQHLQFQKVKTFWVVLGGEKKTKTHFAARAYVRLQILLSFWCSIGAAIHLRHNGAKV